jgi:hypothetical protein
VNVDPVQWFLNDLHDTRSSYYLEDAATEFHVPGLELDWVRHVGRRFTAPYGIVALHSCRGDAWTTIQVH